MTLAPTLDQPFSLRLAAETEAAQRELLAVPFVQAALAGNLERPEYLAFLTQAYHHVKHTVPLLMAAGAACGPTRRTLQDAFVEYVDEERGHDEWILDDIAAAGGDAAAVRRGEPDVPAELLVSYAYDLIARTSPVGFLGMVRVLEGTSVRAACQAAVAIQARLGLPDGAFTYLTSHGRLDLEHVAYFDTVIDTLDDPAEQRLVTHCAHVFFRLYGDVFRALSPRAPRNRSPESLS